jgi:membrane protein required for colicin V production
MNFIDILVLVAVGYGAFKGFQNGVIYEVAGLLGLVVGVWAGMRLAFLFADYYKDNFDLPGKWIPVLAFLTAFLVGMGAVWLAGRIVNALVKTVQLNLVNRLAGSAFGVLKWAFLIGTFLSVIGNAFVLTPEVQAGSATYPYVTTYCKVVQGYSVGLLPQARNVFDDMENYFVELDSTRKSQEIDSLSTSEIRP